jgi:hypothetical protein
VECSEYNTNIHNNKGRETQPVVSNWGLTSNGDTGYIDARSFVVRSQNSVRKVGASVIHNNELLGWNCNR